MNTIRAHRGTDYAAKKGTPVKVTGDGVVTELTILNLMEILLMFYTLIPTQRGMLI
ncbi:MAG: hypothetical protein CM15mP22_6310 [Gammaproteobacteria bacterium]|nr:MAG: hypothetical protein CM15mP22_6310 [Gammaproteobacteria bacterium]